jgi:tetratricopeptide (TPR) repeat protein
MLNTQLELKNQRLANALNDAIIARRAERPLDALRALDDHKAEFYQSDDLYKGKYHNGRSRSLTALKRFAEAHTDARLALDFYTRTGDYSRVAMAHHNIGHIYFKEGKFVLAKSHVQHSISIFTTHSDRYKEVVWKAEAQTTLARIFIAEGSTGLAVSAAYIAYRALSDEVYEITDSASRLEARRVLDCALDAHDGLIEKPSHKSLWQRIRSWVNH